MINIQLFIVDTEVFKHDYLAVFKEKSTGEYLCYWNDPDAITAMLWREDAIFATFNGKHYDRFILSAIARDGRPEIVKAVNDFIISGGNGWQYSDRQVVDFYFPMYDLMDDCQQGLSLKAIEGHLGMDIRESAVPFDIDRPLTDEEKAEVLFYCKHDVDATDKLDTLRRDYLKNKITLGLEKGINPIDALYMTNAKLTAAFLGATAKEHNDEREYKYPETLKLEYIPKEVIDFFDRLKDKSIPDDVLFSEKLDLTVGDCPCTIGYGGIHGAVPCYKETGEI